MFKKIARYALIGSMMPMMAQAQSLEDRVAELEANQSINIFKFSGSFFTRYDNIMKAQQTDPAAGPTNPFNAPFDKKDLSYLRMKFQFNADAEVSKHVKFYSRFTMSKYFNTFYQSGAPTTTAGADLGVSNGFGGSQVVIEKAYADISIPDTNFTFSVGRLPTVDGQPQNYKDGRARMGTYPMMSYDSVLDGFALTYRADEYIPADHKLAMRVIYTPFSQYSLKSRTDSPVDQTGSNLNTQVSAVAAQVDYSVNNLSWAENMGLVAQYLQTGDLYYPNEASTALGNSTINIATGSTTLAAEMMGIAQTGLDLSLTYLATSLKNNGKFNGPFPVGLGTNLSDETINGGIFLLSTRYRLGSWILGAEYLNGSENSFFYAPNDETLTSFYSTRGDAYHAYVTKKFGQNLSLRLGYMDQQYKYTPIALGSPVKTDRMTQTGYANLRLDF